MDIPSRLAPAFHRLAVRERPIFLPTLRTDDAELDEQRAKNPERVRVVDDTSC